jgi:hypothetical protein
MGAGLSIQVVVLWSLSVMSVTKIQREKWFSSSTTHTLNHTARPRPFPNLLEFFHICMPAVVWITNGFNNVALCSVPFSSRLGLCFVPLCLRFALCFVPFSSRFALCFVPLCLRFAVCFVPFSSRFALCFVPLCLRFALCFVPFYSRFALCRFFHVSLCALCRFLHVSLCALCRFLHVSLCALIHYVYVSLCALCRYVHIFCFVFLREA